MDINALVEEKIEGDTEFQASLADLADEDREEAIKTKRSEVLSSEFDSLKEQADKAAKAEELANNYKLRAEKAEKGSKENQAPAEVPAAPSASDIVALSKVHEDDIERVERFAKSEGISIKDALKNSELKAILSVRSEERDTAAAANIGPVRRGPSALTDDALLEKASKGDLPDSDEQIERLMKAKAGQK